MFQVEAKLVRRKVKRAPKTAVPPEVQSLAAYLAAKLWARAPFSQFPREVSQ